MHRRPERLLFAKSTSAVCEVLAENSCAVAERIGISDSFGESGKPEELIEQYGLGVDTLCASARRVLQIKQKRTGGI